MTNINPPWRNMTESSQRRIYSKHELFWITDLHGNYGFCVRAKEISIDPNSCNLNLKGVQLIKRTSNNGYVELFLILNNKEEWEIFLTLCEDLIKVTKKYDSEAKMIQAIEMRLKRWQKLLKYERNHNLSIEKQMGLFSELVCLKDLVAKKYNFTQAIVSWVGPELDKQDFLLDNEAIEVKSHRTSKGDIIQISSVKQLLSEKDPLYLVSYSLTSSENGLSIEDLALDIRKELLNEDVQFTETFDQKLIDYGYIPELIKEPLHKFIIDKQKIYLVTESFPKITYQHLKSQIISVNYSIDLSQCSEYERDNNYYTKGGDSGD